MLEAIISSKTRINLLLKFFLNPNQSAYLRSLADDFGESTNGIRVELNRFEKAGLVSAFSKGNKKIYQANSTHPLFSELRNLVIKHLGIDKLIFHVVDKIGELDRVYLTGDLAHGRDSDVIDVILVGEVDRPFLSDLCEKAESILKRKIKFLIYSKKETESLNFKEENFLLIWQTK